MGKKYRFFGSLLLMSIVKTISLFGQIENEVMHQWDYKTISEANIWQKLLVNYYYADHDLYWPERKESLSSVVENFPKSQWADDAELMHACDMAAFENNLDDGIFALRSIISDYPNATTIVTGWDIHTGCRINATWLKWASNLVSSDQDKVITKTFPFDRDRRICILEREALTYFAHVDKYPIKTKDVAQYIIALMLIANGNISGAIIELENNFTSTQEFSLIRSRDFASAKEPHGYLIESDQPQDYIPIWRVEYAACVLLINLYQLENQNDKALQLAFDLSSGCSPDGWYWNINHFVGNVYLDNGEFNLAAEQYALSLQGINRIIEVQTVRKQKLHEQGYMIKPADFISWEEEAKSSYVNIIHNLENLHAQASSK